MYRGPFKKIEDDDGHVYFRGQRAAVCDKTFRLLQEQPYADSFIPIGPYESISIDQAEPFECRRSAVRHPRETKGFDYSLTSTAIKSCEGEEGECC